MKFGLKLKLVESIKSERMQEFLSEISPAEHIDVIRGVDAITDPTLRAVDASYLHDRYNVFTDILKMSLTQFILLEYAIKANFDEARVASICIRPKDEIEFDNTDQQKEEEHISNLYEEDAATIQFVIKSLMHNREYNLLTKFEGVIYNKIEESEEDEEQDDEPQEVDTFNERWFWYSIVRTLANEDLQKFDFVYSMKMSDVLIELAYRTQLNQRIENERRAEEARRR
jgi:hypothetical protein